MFDQPMDFTVPMEPKEKSLNRYKLGLAIQRIIAKNKLDANESGVKSLRKLAAASGVEYAIIQKISSGAKDPQFTTIVSIAEGLNISLVELFSKFESISNQEVSNHISEIRKKNKSKYSGL